jgi:hypothetical protein
MHYTSKVRIASSVRFVTVCWTVMFIAGSTIGQLVIRPSNQRVPNGTGILLQCTTSYTAFPVVWFCKGTCSADKSAKESKYIFLYDAVQDPYTERVSVVRSHSGQYDLEFSAFYEGDAGNYSCVDRHGIGDRADAEVVVVVVTRRPPDGGDQRVTSPLLAATKFTASVSPRQTVSTTVLPSHTASVYVAAAVVASTAIVVTIAIALVVYLWRKRIYSGFRHCLSSCCCFRDEAAPASISSKSSESERQGVPMLSTSPSGNTSPT